MPEHPPTVSRRLFLRGSALAAGSAAVATPAALSAVPAAVSPISPAAAVRPDAQMSRFQDAVEVRVAINGVDHALILEPRVTLLDALRERLRLTGTKKGCDRGECGACTVLLDDQPVNACLVLAAATDGRQVTTIEGLATGSRLHPVQQAFIDHDAFQCGFCTSGQIMSAVGCIAAGQATSNAAIREWMSGNLCRCAAYPQIAAAVEAAAQEDV